MPEIPDLNVYLDCIGNKAAGKKLERIRIGNPFLLRSVSPAPEAFEGKKLQSVQRIGKRVVLSFEGQFHAVIHLMILGRLHWKKPAAALPKGSGLAAFDFADGSLHLTESGKKRRASLHLVEGNEALTAFDRGGLEPLECTESEFVERLKTSNRTLKRALTDPEILAGIGNAYSDEILHAAGLSPFLKTQALPKESYKALFKSVKKILEKFSAAIAIEAEKNKGWPVKVTAFRPNMAVHGLFGQPCPACGHKIQRIVYASNEANYCAACQTGGKLLADRALSKLLHESWPRNIDEI